MTDREKTIKGLEWILEDDRFGFGVNWNTNCEPKSEEEQAGVNIQNALELLKEQEAVVRCKDCRNNNQCSIQFKFADADNPGDWFCADGAMSDD